MTENKNRAKYNPLVCLHRLAMCIKDNIKGLTVHHIDKNKFNNNIKNLLPVTQEENNSYELLNMEEQIKKGIEVKKYYDKKKKEKSKQLKQTISRNEELQKEIIIYSLKHKGKEVIKKFKNKIKTPQTIRNIVNYYFYAKEFLNWLKTMEIKGYSD